jgi:hypothetical protein
MATTRHTSGWRGQKINAQYVSTLQENRSHRIRRRTATSKATFFYFSLSFSLFSPLYHECNPSSPLRRYKGEAGATSKGAIKQQQLEPTSIETTHHTPPLTRDLGSAPYLESL